MTACPSHCQPDCLLLSRPRGARWGLHFPESQLNAKRCIWSAIAAVWPHCILDPAVVDPGVVVDIIPGESETQEIVWRAYQEPLFDQYLALLRDIQPSDLAAPGHSPRILDISEITLLEALGGRGCSKRVQLQDAGKLSTFVFKGIDFQTYLQLHDDDDELARTMVNVWRRSSKLIANMPRHLNIQSPLLNLVSVRDSN